MSKPSWQRRTRRPSPLRRAARRGLCACAALAIAAGAGSSVAGIGASAAAGASGPRGTMIGDSVAASLSYVASARALLDRGIAMQYDLKVCRRLVAPSCPYQGVAPTTALQAVRSYGRSLGAVLIIDVGYNDAPQGYAQAIDEIMRAALRQGVTGVVWVTLRETGVYAALYRSTNAEIRAATRRWPQLIVADWDAFSAGKPWFAGDGLHLSATGATELAAFLRPFVSRAEIARHATR